MTTLGDPGTPGGGGTGEIACWCCGQRRAQSAVVRLGSHPEVVVCLNCAHSLHLRAREREDAGRPSPTARLRDVLRAGRRGVVQHGWHRAPVIGAALRWLGRRLP